MTSLDENTRIFEEERINLGLQNTPVDLVIADYESEIIQATPLNMLKLIVKIIVNGVTMKCERVPFAAKVNGQYVVSIPSIDSHNSELFRGRVRHELWHVADGHCDRTYRVPMRWLVYHFYDEPRANKYAKGEIKGIEKIG